MIEQTAKTMPDHVQIAYKDAIDNIMFVKRQQWQITNYSLIAYGALVSMPVFSEVTIGKKETLVLVALILVFAIYVLFDLQNAITKFRFRVYWVYHNYFSESEIAGMNISGVQKSFWYQPIFFLGLLGVVTFGAMLSGYMIYSRS